MHPVGVSPSSGFVAHIRERDGSEQTISDHLRGVAKLSKSFATKMGLERAGELIGLLHDLGKYSSAFQSYLKSATGVINPDEDHYVDAGVLKGKIDHSTAGAQQTWKHLRTRTPLGPFAGQILALCIASHHSGLIDCIAASRDSFGQDAFTGRMKKAGTKTYLDEVLVAAEPEILHRAEELLGDPNLLIELKQLADRVFSANQ